MPLWLSVIISRNSKQENKDRNTYIFLTIYIIVTAACFITHKLIFHCNC